MSLHKSLPCSETFNQMYLTETQFFFFQRISITFFEFFATQHDLLEFQILTYPQKRVSPMKSKCTFVSLCICIRIILLVYLHVHVSVHGYVKEYVFAFLYVDPYSCVYVCTSVCRCMFHCVCIPIFAHVCMHVYVYVTCKCVNVD